MTTPAQYRHQFDELKAEPIPADDVATAQADAALERISELQTKAQELERAINLDLQVIRVQYRSRVAAATSGASSRVQVSNKRRLGSRMRAEEADQINLERDSKLSPYEEVRKEVEEYLAQLALLRTKVEQRVQKGEAVEKDSPKQTE